ncbi:MAG: DedA family protein [Thermoprotei archaeon]|nr:MAG: DedA family protein [Thermoprotei archaeon]
MALVGLLMNWLIGVVRRLSCIGVLILMIMESACLPIPSEIVMPLAGFALCNSMHDILIYSLIGTIANLIGSWIAYLVGMLGGRPVLFKYGKYVLLTKKELIRAETLFKRYGDITVLIGRMLPAIRTVISLPAGIFLLNPVRFTLYTFIGSLPWNFFLTYLGYELGENWYIIEEYMKYLDIAVIIGTAILIVYVLRRIRENGR